MSYRFVLGATSYQMMGALGINVSMSTSATTNVGGKGGAAFPTLPDCGTLPSFALDCCEKVKKTGGTFDQKTKAIKDCAVKKATEELVPCDKAGVTGNETIDKAIVDCCEATKRGSGNYDQKAADIAKCVAKNTAKLYGAAVGTAAGAALCGATVVLAPAAPLCGLLGGVIGGAVGGFLYDRVSGYSTGQIVGGLVAGAICGVISGGTLAVLCGFAAAELIGWLTDTVGPAIEAIFDPGAAKRRELAARAAYHSAIEANEKACKQADEKYSLAWGLGVGSIKELYRKAFKTSVQKARSQPLLGFVDNYDSIARAMRAAGAASMQLVYTAKGTRGCWDEASSDKWDPKMVTKYRAMECSNCANFDYIRTGPADSKDPWKGVEASWLTDGPGLWSDVCPFSVCTFYYAEREKALGKSPSRDAVTKWEKDFAPTIKAVAEQIYPSMQSAITQVATKITMAAVAMQQQDIIEAAHTATRAGMATRIAKAASVAESAADAAKKGNAEEGRRAVQRANQQYDIAAAAYKKLLTDEFGGYNLAGTTACLKDVNCKKADAALARAALAKKNAPIFAAQAAEKRLVIGCVIAASVAGATYLAVRK